MAERQKTIELKGIPDLDIGVVEAKVGLSEADVQPNSLRFRIKKDKRSIDRKVKWSVALGLVVLLLGGMSATLRFVPDVREMAIQMVKELAKTSQNPKVIQLTKPILALISQGLKAHRPEKVAVVVEPVTNSLGTCGAYITGAITKKLKTALSDAEFLHLINCELFQDSPKFAYQSLEKKHVSLTEGISWDNLPLSLLTLEATRRMAPLSPLPIFPKQGCLRWTAQPDCLMRYVDEAHASFKSRWQDGFKTLGKEIGKQAPSVQAWFYLASSLYATKDHEYSKSAQYLESAYQAIHNDPNPYLEREIYRNGTINGFLSNDEKIVGNTLNLMPVKRVEEAPTAFLDVDLLEQLRTKEARGLLETYLLQPESAQRFASDPRFIGIILSQTQKLGLEAQGLALASQVFGPRDKVRAEAIGEAMILLYARMWLGAEKSFEALEILTQLEKSGFRSAEMYHLKGLAQLAAFKKPEVRLLAAKNFQTAAGLNRSEESLLAMLVALLDAKEHGKANQVMREWKALGPAAQKSMWYGFALGLISYTGGDKMKASAFWSAAELANKKNLLWSHLKSNIATDPTYLEQDLAKTLSLLLGHDSPIGSLALYGQKS